MTDIDAMDRPPVPEGWPTCRVCGCWEMAACWDDEAGACWWVAPDLCSHCPGELPPAERPAVSPGLRALCFGAAYGLVIGLVIGLLVGLAL